MRILSLNKSVSMSILGALILGGALTTPLFAKEYTLKNSQVVSQGPVSKYFPHFTANTAASTPLKQVEEWASAYEAFYRKNKGKVAPGGHCVSLGTYDNKTGDVFQSTVYIKEITKEGVVFESRPNTQKVRNATAHPKASMLFLVAYPDRAEQVEFRGVVEPVEDTNTDARSDRKNMWKRYILKPRMATVALVKFYDLGTEGSILPIVDRVSFALGKDGKWAKKSQPPYYGGNDLLEKIEKEHDPRG